MSNNFSLSEMLAQVCALGLTLALIAPGAGAAKEKLNILFVGNSYVQELHLFGREKCVASTLFARTNLHIQSDGLGTGDVLWWTRMLVRVFMPKQ